MSSDGKVGSSHISRIILNQTKKPILIKFEESLGKKESKSKNDKKKIWKCMNYVCTSTCTDSKCPKKYCPKTCHDPKCNDPKNNKFCKKQCHDKNCTEKKCIMKCHNSKCGHQKKLCDFQNPGENDQCIACASKRYYKCTCPVGRGLLYEIAEPLIPNPKMSTDYLFSCCNSPFIGSIKLDFPPNICMGSVECVCINNSLHIIHSDDFSNKLKENAQFYFTYFMNEGSCWPTMKYVEDYLEEKQKEQEAVNFDETNKTKKDPLLVDVVKQLKRLNSDEIKKSDQSCVICIDDIKEKKTVIELPCNHQFCENCLIDWFKEKNTCPCCKVIPTIEKSNKVAEKTSLAQLDPDELQKIYFDKLLEQEKNELSELDFGDLDKSNYV